MVKMKPLKLITEDVYNLTLNEEVDDSGIKSLYISGLFSASDIKNANERIYSREILEREINKFIDEKVTTKTAIGHLNHPNSPEIDLEKAAILVESLEWKGDEVYGRAKILSTPAGMIARALIDDGVTIGISSRGLGSVNEDSYVNEDYQLITYDLVSSPSQPGAWMKGIYEAKTFDVGVEEEAPKIDETKVVEEAREKYYKKLKGILDEFKTSKLNEGTFGDRLEKNIYNLIIDAEAMIGLYRPSTPGFDDLVAVKEYLVMALDRLKKAMS
jgi:hypothetical protein